MVNSTEELNDLMCDLLIRISEVCLLNDSLDLLDGLLMPDELEDVILSFIGEICTLLEGCDFSGDGMSFRQEVVFARFSVLTGVCGMIDAILRLSKKSGG